MSPLTLSGYLPGEREQNLTDLAEDLVARFDHELHESGEVSILIPVIGMLRVESVRRSRTTEKEPTVEVRFASLEVPAGADVETIRTQWRQLRDKRVGEEPLPLEWDPADGPADGDTGAHPGAATVRTPTAAPEGPQDGPTSPVPDTGPTRQERAAQAAEAAADLAQAKLDAEDAPTVVGAPVVQFSDAPSKRRGARKAATS